jgi:HPt (histidine-containing phosphotransfer) domain-containing protein
MNLESKGPPIDIERLVHQCQGDHAFVREMLGVLQRQCELYLDQLRQGVAVGDRETACRGAHGLKGSAGNAGAGTLSRLCAEFEARAQVTLPPDATDAACAIADEWRRCVAYFPTILAALK